MLIKILESNQLCEFVLLYTGIQSYNRMQKQFLADNEAKTVNKNVHWSEFIKEGSHGVMVKVLDCGIIVHEFDLSFVHFRTNTL